MKPLIGFSQAAAPRDNAVIADHCASWIAQWARLTAAAAVIATIFDAFLLQYRRSYFTGGFLSSDFVSSPLQAFGFFAGSLVADAGTVGIVLWGALWLLGRLAVHRYIAFGAAFLLALLPVFAADLIEYQLLTYLGDAFDFRLLFDLSGRNMGEVFAVTSAHVSRFVWLGAAVLIPAILGLWIVSRQMRLAGGHLSRPPLWRSLIWPIAGLIAAATMTTMLRSGSDVLDNGLRRKPTGRLLGSIVEAASDVDRDGYGILGRPDDPRLFDGRVRPYALDIPGNDVDEDGVAGDLPADLKPYDEGQPQTSWQSRPDVVLIVLESFRADLRGGHVGGRPVTPVLDRLAATGIAPQHAYSHNGYTVQSRRHIFTGSTADIRGTSTLIDDFKQHGYEVAYFSGQDESFGGPRQGVGFDRADVAYDARADRERRYSDFTTAGSLAIPYNVVQERVGAFLDSRRNDKPLFLYVNFHDTHFPYHHGQVRPLLNVPVVGQSLIAPDRAEQVRDMYANTAANVDRAIGEVIERVRRALGREPGVLVLSDHGESLFDEGFLGHGYALNDAQTRIPVIVSGLPLALEEPFGQADLRDAIGAALSKPDGSVPRPTLTTNPSRTVFQYLGVISRPAQIALTSIHGRVIYDFREGRARIGTDQWRRPGDLTGDHLAAYRDLIHLWERMMIARNTAALSPELP